MKSITPTEPQIRLDYRCFLFMLMQEKKCCASWISVNILTFFVHETLKIKVLISNDCCSLQLLVSWWFWTSKPSWQTSFVSVFSRRNQETRVELLISFVQLCLKFLCDLIFINSLLLQLQIHSIWHTVSDTHRRTSDVLHSVRVGALGVFFWGGCRACSL